VAADEAVLNKLHKKANGKKCRKEKKGRKTEVMQAGGFRRQKVSIIRR
jgi:hypothetical protein